MKRKLSVLFLVLLTGSLFAQNSISGGPKSTLDYPCQSFTIGWDQILLSHPMEDNNVFKTCSGDVISLAVTANFPNNNTSYQQTLNNTQFIWKIGDFAPDTMANVNRSFMQPAFYHFVAYAVDVNGCYSSNRISGTIINSYNPIVSHDPIVNMTTNSQVVLTASENENDFLTYSPVVVSKHYTTNQFSNYDTVFIPDGNGISYVSQIIVNDFPANDTLDNINKIKGIHLNLEHTFLGDLSIKITCPTGASTVLKAFQSTQPAITGSILTPGSIGGGNLNLGMASEAPNSSSCFLHEGIGWDYEFRPGATTGFGKSDSIFYNYLDNCNQTWHGPSLIPSEITSYISDSIEPVFYGSYETWDNLIGCPLNGTWQITVQDHYNVDNGYIFNWGIDFADTMQNQMTEYVVGVDSAIFRGPWIQQLTPFSAQITYPNVGGFAYEVNVYDEFGCDFIATFGIICVLNIHEQDDLNALSFYPNPAINELNCKILDPAWENSLVEIYSITGQLINQEKLNTIDSKINVASLAKGTYFLKVTNSQKDTQTFKLIKK